MSDWITAKLKEVAKVVTGKTPQTSNSEYYGGDIPFVSPADLNEGILSETKTYLTSSGADQVYRVPKNTVLVSCIGNLGKLAITSKEVCFNQQINGLIFDEQKIFPKYGFYFAQTLKPQLEKASSSTTLPIINKSRFSDLEIKYPPLAEQRRIASILDQADELRQKRQQAIEKLDQLLQATFIDMFGDPVSNPKGWERVSAKNVLKIQGGFAFSSTDFSKSGIPVVKIGNANKLGFSTEKFDFIIPQYPEKLTQYELRSGDLLMSLTGTVGKDDYGNITEVTDDYDLYYLNQRVAKLEVTNTLFSKNYIRYFFSQSSIKALITKNNRGVRQANISNSDLYELDIPLPTKAQLDKFDSFIESINETKRYSKVQLISSNKLFFALQNQAFSGTL
ncbi:restriction endonuclease subunit S [Acinetobacter guillouiae]|uniref:restriction endonuclease subunit S n=1 Tax=Acinetobacter TaxID=469 RepID=UPI003AF64C92